VDAEGKDVISKLNEEILSDIASKAQGIYQRLQNAEQVANTLGTQISSTEQKNFGDSIFTDYDSYFQYFLGFSLLLLLIEPMIPEKKSIR
jgi:Ca-activated chloride channel family protein